MAPWPARLVGLLTLALSPAAMADTLLPPPNVILPNYDRTLVGKIPSLEAGAYSARVSDASANWYNPAGLLHSKGTEINASTSAYRWTSVQLSAAQEATGSVTGGQPPSFLGLVIGEPVIGTARFRAGFSLTNETYWAPMLQNQVLTSNAPDSNLRLLYSTRDTFTETLPAVSVAFASSDSWRFGVSVAGDIVNYQATDSLSNQMTNPTSQYIFSRSAQINASAVNILGIAGLQVDASEHWKLSLVAKTPSLRLLGSARVTLENIESKAGTLTDIALFDPSGEFRYSRPFQVSFGVAYVSRAFEVEADLRYSAKIDPYSAFSSAQPVLTTTSSGGGPPTTTNGTANDVTIQYRSITNLAVGTKYRLTDAVSLHGGYFRSNSPLVQGDSTIYRKIDLNGLTFGAALTIGNFSGSLGGAYEFGKSEPYSVPNTLTGASTPTTIHVSAISVLYAVSFSF